MIFGKSLSELRKLKYCCYFFPEITVFHQGTDGVSFDSIGIETEEYDVYDCVFQPPAFLDGDMWESTMACSGN